MTIKPFQSIRTETAWYRVLQHIGSGGNGVVFLVTCTCGQYRGEIFAMKVFSKILDEKRKERFLAEVKFMKDKHHPSIMRQYDEGVFIQGDAEFPFVIMEYLPYTLEEGIKKGIDISDALLYSLQLLSAVKYIHEHDIVHRDIKPGNIFINNHSAILGDFGLIKKIDNDVESDADEIKGYFAMPCFYRTPELIGYAKGECPVCKESDVFQLGLVLFHMFTSKYPLQPTKDLLSEIKIKNLYIPECGFEKCIASTLWAMVEINKDKRITIERALEQFNLTFESYCKTKMTQDKFFA